MTACNEKAEESQDHGNTESVESETTMVSSEEEPSEEASVDEENTEGSEVQEGEHTHGPEEEFIEGFTIFATEASSIQIQYPMDWEPYEDYTYGGYYTFEAPKTPREKVSPKLMISEDENEYANVSAFAQSDFEDDKLHKKFEMYEDKVITLGGQDAIYKEFMYHSHKPGFGWVDTHVIQIYVLNGGFSYDIRFATIEPSNMDNYKPTVEQMLETLVFKEPTA